MRSAPRYPAGGRSHGIVQTNYYSFIDGLRGVAILMVLAVHLRFEPLEPEAFQSLISSGARGVQLFFILSAFTLFSTSLQRFPHERHPRRNFYVRRAFRILPLWWLCIGTYAWSLAHYGLVFDQAQVRPVEVLRDGLFLFGFTAHMHPLVPGAWTLFVEESFYWILPLVVGFVTDLSRAAALTLGLLVLSVAWYPVSWALLRGDPQWADLYFFFPFSQWFIFGLGFVLYFLVLRQNGEKHFARPLVLLADVAAAILLWAAFVSRPLGPAIYVAGLALALLCFVTSQPGSIWARLIDVAPLRVFGQCCYSIYLFHQLLLRVLQPLRAPVLDALRLSTDHPDLRFAAWFVVVAGAALAIGHLSFWLFEKPLVRLGRRVIDRLDANDPVLASADSARGSWT